MGDELKIGFIGQGYVGSSYADDFEDRGFSVVRYALESPYNKNKDKIKECDIIFVAVPTPTTPTGFDDSILRDVLSLVGKGKIAVIKSTVLPGKTEELQNAYPDIVVFHSPEFLRAATAGIDAKKPHRNIIGLPIDNSEYRRHAELVMNTLPSAPVNLICTAREAEITKYAANCFLYTKVIYFNLINDLAKKLGADFEIVRQGIVADPRIGESHSSVVADGGRGAGGFCFIKDMAALREFYEKELSDDESGLSVLKSIEKKNIELLKESGKDPNLLEGVYGK